jgi:hypothetical protein
MTEKKDGAHMAESAEAGFAPLKMVRSLAKEMPSQYLVCRDMQHSWRPHTVKQFTAAERKENKGAYYEQVLMCISCEKERVRLLAKDCTVISDRSTYPEGYLMPRGTGRLSREGRSALRQASILRQISGK